MVVTGSASRSQPEPNRRGRFHSVDGITHVILVIDGTAFTGRYITAVKPCRDPLFQGWLGQQIASELFHGELIKRLIAVERPNHPISVRPDRTFIVQMQSVRITITCSIQPEACHVFPIPGRLQQPVDDAFIGLLRIVIQKVINLLHCRR